jgi:glycosyltransferase involved in cell wall biosynthesis
MDLGNKNRFHVIRSFQEWNIVKRVLAKYPGLQEIIFMEIDSFLFLISSREFRRFKLKIKGILFQPYIHFQEIKGGPSFHFRKIWKNFIIQKYSLLVNRHVKKLFILNDKQGVKVLNNKLKNLFGNIPDPIDIQHIEIDPAFKKTITTKYQIDDSKKNLLVFGSIDNRKNLHTIIEALLLLPKEVKQNIHLIISGKFNKDCRSKYLKTIQKAQEDISISYNDDFVKAPERETLFEYCDLVLMPYINFFSASSVVGHAIAHNKNIIGPDKGLLAKIIRDNKLGLNVNPHCKHEIRDAIEKIIGNPNDFKFNGEQLIKEYDPAHFSELLLTA